jgi:hypothetical protein
MARIVGCQGRPQEAPSPWGGLAHSLRCTDTSVRSTPPVGDLDRRPVLGEDAKAQPSGAQARQHPGDLGERLHGDLVVLALDQLLEQCWRWVLDAEGFQHDAVEDTEPRSFFVHGAQRLAVAFVQVAHASSEGSIGVVQPQPGQMGVDGRHKAGTSKPASPRFGDRGLIGRGRPHQHVAGVEQHPAQPRPRRPRPAIGGLAHVAIIWLADAHDLHGRVVVALQELGTGAGRSLVSRTVGSHVGSCHRPGGGPRRRAWPGRRAAAPGPPCAGPG